MIFLDNQQNWHLASEGGGESFVIEKRIDSRGEFEFYSSAVITVGKTIRSGKLNIPINAFYIPSKQGGRFGISFGFNATRRKS